MPTFKRLPQPLGPPARTGVPMRLEPLPVRQWLTAEDFMSRNTTILVALNADGTAPTNLNKLAATLVGGTALATIHQGLNLYYLYRATVGEMNWQFGPINIHPLLDPSGAPSRKVLVWEDTIQLYQEAATDYQACLGWVDTVTANDFTTRTGIGFSFDKTGTNTWHCFVREASTGFVAPYTDLYDVDTGLLGLDVAPYEDPFTALNIHRLCLVLDGRHRRVRWYIDGALVAEYTFAATPGRLAGAAGTLLRYKLFVPTANQRGILNLWGGNYELLRIYDVME